MVLLLLPITPAERDLLTLYDNVICVIFLVDFAMNLAGAKPKRAYFIGQRGWLDLLGSIPTSASSSSRALLRLARLSRLARIGRLLRGQAGKELVDDVLKNRGQYATFITILLAGIVLSVGERARPRVREPVARRQHQDRRRCHLVGHRDDHHGRLRRLLPGHILGRLTGVFVMFAGIGIIGALASILASLLVSPAPTEPSRAESRLRR